MTISGTPNCLNCEIFGIFTVRNFSNVAAGDMRPAGRGLETHGLEGALVLRTQSFETV